MGTVPTDELERKLRQLYLKWTKRMTELNAKECLEAFIDESAQLIETMGGQIARRAVSAGFPAPQLLDLAEYPGRIYTDAERAMIKAGIAIGLNANDIARAMFDAGMNSAHWQLKRLARSEVVRAYWQNQRNEAKALGLVLVWSVEESARTCQWCKERDGLVADEGCYDHPNGRCTLIPMRAEDIDYKGSVDANGNIYIDDEWDSKVEKVLSGEFDLLDNQG